MTLPILSIITSSVITASQISFFSEAAYIKSLFYNKVIWHRYFPVDFAQTFFKNTCFTEYLRTTASIFYQKQPFRGVLRKSRSENMKQITPMPKCDFNKVALQLY